MLLLRWSQEQARNCEDQRDEDTECDGRILGQTKTMMSSADSTANESKSILPCLICL